MRYRMSFQELQALPVANGGNGLQEPERTEGDERVMSGQEQGRVNERALKETVDDNDLIPMELSGTTGSACCKWRQWVARA